MPADTVDPGQGKHGAEVVDEHAPQALLEFFGIDPFLHLVLADHLAGGYGLIELSLQELLAGDVGEDDPVSPGEDQPACVLGIVLLMVHALPVMVR